MNVVLDNEYTRSLKDLARRIPRPRAVLVVSAHWLTDGTFVCCSERPRQIYDFFGFPEELYRVVYEPAGSPEVAERAVALLRSRSPAIACNGGWGHDHAGWSVLVHLYPEADVPVSLLSIDMAAPPRRHTELAALLAPLRDEGVLILGSGNIVHNLRVADLGDVEAPPDPPGLAFDAAVRDALEGGDLQSLVEYKRVQGAEYAVPTPDHYYPMLWAAALRQPEDALTFTCEIFQNRSVSMRGFAVGLG